MLELNNRRGNKLPKISDLCKESSNLVRTRVHCAKKMIHALISFFLQTIRVDLTLKLDSKQCPAASERALKLWQSSQQAQ